MKRPPAKSSAKKSTASARSTKPVVPSAVLEFLPGWQEKLSGDLRQGGSLTVRYASDRLTGCRSTHNGVAAWELHGFVKFQPSGQLVSGPLVEHVDDATGQVIVPPRPVAITVDVPADASVVELWFKNSDVFGCVAWDSRMGENYRFEVQSAVKAKPVKAPRTRTVAK